MVTGPQLRASLAPLLDMHAFGRFDRYLGALAEAGLARRSGHGARNSAVYFTKWYPRYRRIKYAAAPSNAVPTA